MAYELAKAYVQIVPTTKGITGQLENQLGGEAGKAGASAGGKFGTSFGSALKTGGKIMAAGAVAVTAATAGTTKALISGVTSVSEYGDEVDKTSQKLGLSAESYQKWDYVMKLAGTEMSSMTTGLKTMTNQLDDAKNGSADAQARFEKLGLSLDDLNSMSREEAFEAVIKGFQGMEDSTERAALANDIFGKSGQNLTPLFNQTAEQTAEQIALSEKYGMIMSDDMVKASARYQDALTTAQGAMTGLKNQMLGELLPGFADVVEGFSAVVTGTEGGSEQIKSGISSILTSVKDILPRILNIVSDVLLSITEMLPDFISSVVAILPDLFDSVIETLTTLIPNLAKILPDLISTVVDLIVSLVTHLDQIIMPIIKAIPTIIKSLVSALVQNLPTIISGLIDLVTDIVTELPSICMSIIEYIPELMIGIGKAIIEAIPKILSAVVEIVKSIGRALLGLEDPVKTAEEKLTGLADRAQTSWDTISETLNTPVSTEGLLSSLGHTEDEIQSTIDEKEAAIRDILSTRLSEQEGLRQEDLDKIREYQEEIRALEEEKVSIYNSQAHAELTAMQNMTDASAVELLERYNNVVQYNDLARQSAETAYNQQLVDANNFHTAMESELQAYLDNGGLKTDQAYIEMEARDQAHYDDMVATAKASYDQRIADLDATEQQALLIALNSNNAYAQQLQSHFAQLKSDYDSNIADITDWDIQMEWLLGGVTDKTAAAFDSMVDSISDADIANTQAMLSMIATAKQTGVEIPDEMNDTAKQILEVWSNLPPDLQDEGGNVMKGLIAGVSDQVPELKNVSEGGAKDMVKAVENALGIHSPSTVMKGIGTNTMLGMTQGMNSMRETVSSTASSIAYGAVSAMQGMGLFSSGWSIGQNLMHGIAGGISSLGGHVGAIAAQVVADAVARAKHAGGIQSPSTVMRDEVGLMLAEGLGIGIKEGTPYVIDAVNSVNDSMMEQVKDIDLTEQILPETIAATADYRQRMQAAAAAGGTLARMQQYSSVANNSENQTVTLNIYGAAGQDVNALADIIIDRMQWLTAKENAIYA